MGARSSVPVGSLLAVLACGPLRRDGGTRVHVRRPSLRIGGVIVAANLLVGCGGIDPSAGGGDASSDADATTSTAADANPDDDSREDVGAACPAACPAQEPQVGAACTTPCEYIVDASTGCIRYYDCLSNQFQPGALHCLGLPGVGCPATAAEIPVRGPCDLSAAPCGYPGSVCQCVYVYDPFDASIEWDCFTIAPDCPPIAPLVGSACSRSDQQCSYGANPCAAQGFGFFVCQNCVWTSAIPLPCK